MGKYWFTMNGINGKCTYYISKYGFTMNGICIRKCPYYIRVNMGFHQWYKQEMSILHHGKYGFAMNGMHQEMSILHHGKYGFYQWYKQERSILHHGKCGFTINGFNRKCPYYIMVIFSMNGRYQEMSILHHGK